MIDSKKITKDLIPFIRKKKKLLYVACGDYRDSKQTKNEVSQLLEKQGVKINATTTTSVHCANGTEIVFYPFLGVKQKFTTKSVDRIFWNQRATDSITMPIVVDISSYLLAPAPEEKGIKFTWFKGVFIGALVLVGVLLALQTCGG
jgi:hypothetical protein